MWFSRFAIACLLTVHPLCAEAEEQNAQLRGSVANSRIQFEKTGKGHVAFIGGSITEMNGYRPMVCEFLQKRFPDTEFAFTAAGISSTCSTTGAFRLSSDVLSAGPVDLFFIEFAVNDDQDAGHARRECIRGLEGIIRQCRRHNPNMDIVVTYFVNPGMRDLLEQGKVPVSIEAHATVARHYSIPTIHLAHEVAERITADTLTWKVFGGTHPAPAGNRICADMIEEMLSTAWSDPLPAGAKPAAHPLPLPDRPVDAGNYGDGRFIDPAKADLGADWKLHVPDWKNLPGGKRGRFTTVPLLCATQPGAVATLTFSGRAIGAYLLAGPDAGAVEVSIDDGPFHRHDLFHRFSRGLHYPRTVIFDADLKSGEHTLRVRISETKNAASKGHAARILQFVAN